MEDIKKSLHEAPAGMANPKGDVKKSPADENKEFGKETIFVCVQDCYRKGVRYRRGQEIKGTKCPPWFEELKK